MIYTPKNLAELELENNLFDNPLQCEGIFFLGNRQNLSWDEIDRDELMDFIDDAFEDYIREKYREFNG
jgi:hypothetical protein